MVVQCSQPRARGRTGDSAASRGAELPTRRACAGPGPPGPGSRFPVPGPGSRSRYYAHAQVRLKDTIG